MLTLLKLGGSLITDKAQPMTLRSDVLKRIAEEVHAGWQRMETRLIIGHGSGSFGHVEAKQYDTINGVQSEGQWRGFAKVATVAAALNFHVADALNNADLPVMRFQPSALAQANDGQVVHMDLATITQALDHHLLPLVYGDVAFDAVRGGTIISTETLFSYLTQHMPVTRIILCGEVDGVYDGQGEVIEHIRPDNFDTMKTALGGARGVDVTGGMLQKVHDSLRLATHPPYPDVWIINGLVAGRITEALVDETLTGTRISR